MLAGLRKSLGAYTLNPQLSTLNLFQKRLRGSDVFAFPIVQLILVANGC